MKNLMISLSVIATLALSQTSFAKDLSMAAESNTKIDTIIVVSQPEPANFEVFSLRHAQSAINESVELMVESFASEFVEEAAAITEIAASAGSAI